jgi:hypothetical protein
MVVSRRCELGVNRVQQCRDRVHSPAGDDASRYSEGEEGDRADGSTGGDEDVVAGPVEPRSEVLVEDPWRRLGLGGSADQIVEIDKMQRAVKRYVSRNGFAERAAGHYPSLGIRRTSFSAYPMPIVTGIGGDQAAVTLSARIPLL